MPKTTCYLSIKAQPRALPAATLCTHLENTVQDAIPSGSRAGFCLFHSPHIFEIGFQLQEGLDTPATRAYLQGVMAGVAAFHGAKLL